MNLCSFPGPHGCLVYRDATTSHASGPPRLLLHGFTGSSRDFLGMSPDLSQQQRWLAPDLPGHGQTCLNSPDSFNADAQVALLERWATALRLPPVHLLGYSMGGRMALQWAVRHPQRLASLVLVSTSAGLESVPERQARAAADRQLAQRLLTQDPAQFLQGWLRQPLFAGIAQRGEAFLAQEVARRLPQQPEGLARSLRGFGSGVMPAVWQDLPWLKLPVLVIAGRRDPAYVQRAERLCRLLPNARLCLLDTSHAPLVEAPDLFWNAVSAFWGGLARSAPATASGV